MTRRLVEAVQAHTETDVDDAFVASGAPIWRRPLETAIAALLVLVVLAFDVPAIIGVIVALPLLALSAWVFRTERIVAITGGVLSVFDTTSQVLVTRPQALVATAPAHEIKRVSPGLMSDRWQIGTASVLVPRSRRGDLERWRALAAPA